MLGMLKARRTANGSHAHRDLHNESMTEFQPPFTPSLEPASLVIVMPLFNDWASAGVLLRQLDELLITYSGSVQVVLLNDGSNQLIPDNFPGKGLEKVRAHVLSLRRNLGHQRVICVGVSFIAEHCECSAMVIMDCDGEDKPEDVLALLRAHEACDGRQIIFAERARRSEGLMFSLGYKVFRAFHRLLTGIPLRFGNFSLVPGTLVKTLPLVSETWSHYAAAVIKAALPYRSIPTHRGTRIAGKSTMRLPALIAHGLSAISVFAEIVSVRLLVFGGAISIPIVLFMLVVVTVRLTTNLGVPGWATYSSLLLLTLLLQILALVGGLSLGLHAFRNSLTFIPLRDYRWFIGPLRRVGVLNEGGR